MRYTLSDNTWDNKEFEALNEVIASGFFSMGEKVKAFEQDFAKKFNSKYAVMSNSGSSANLLAIAALVYSKKLNAGDEVLVPAVSWSTTYFPLSQHNLKLKFIDIDAKTLNMDVTQVEAAITPNTKAIFAVNLLGNPNDFDALNSICKKHNLILLEDNCESMGAFYKGKAAGTIGEMGTFSTFYSHHLCTMEGGVTVTDNEELYHYMLSIRAHGWTRNLPKDSKIYKKKEDAFYESFNFIMPGYNLRPIEMEGALGIEQLKKLDGIIAQRRENAKYFKSQINDLEGYRFQQETEDSSWFGFAIILEGKNKGKRSQLVKLLDQNNIDARPVVAGNFVRNKAVEYLDYSVHNTLENADYIHDEAFFVGNHSKDNKEHVDRLISCLKSFSNA
ncbi:MULTISPECIES: DegT/DnrJ/EryC1/StrS family aminotransferase [unclassified Olleya]|jgi:CDP-6-deoxy-D-xylo-4-hexulose-3-dehydrase|uniref:DegT/DnrJ/EryC1/StrS family aminotransferase n=1 Tax=unclassified Olleya TaxID=2615019 RepID=UPI0011A0370C|nr:DegT/DnrJ/EryC1/StrS family aminotransferase [Olleya sp. Hel_I_94]TVZ48100.1 CDP-6-deoxy-D-xylo-4-hexulose-3-dehydrase [Olleya sp. Hel_I_94]|tara:strand:- start:50050 stop:51216 length:1167 start_codon:yes stop_codon:yes gene_type:complete